MESNVLFYLPNFIVVRKNTYQQPVMLYYA